MGGAFMRTNIPSKVIRYTLPCGATRSSACHVSCSLLYTKVSQMRGGVKVGDGMELLRKI